MNAESVGRVPRASAGDGREAGGRQFKADFLTDSLMLSVFSLRFQAGIAQQVVLRTVFCFLCRVPWFGPE